MEGDATLGTHSTTGAARRWLSPALFGLAALAFLLPFATVSCDQAKTSFTGMQLVTHTVPHGGTVNEPPDCSGDLSRCVEKQGSTLAAAALVAAVLGFALGILGLRRGPGWCAAAGLVAILLLPFRSEMATVNFQAGYFLTLALFAWAAVLHARRAFQRRRERRRTASSAASQSAAPTPAMRSLPDGSGGR